jgi:hypothetical protein
MVRRIGLEQISDLPTFSDDFVLVTCSVSDTGAGLFLFVERAAKKEVSENFIASKKASGTFADFSFRTRMNVRFALEERSRRFVKAKMTNRPWHTALLQISDGQSQVVELGALDLTFPIVDVFPDGRILVTNRWPNWCPNDDDYDNNGVIVDPSTGEHFPILLGGGLEALSIDTLGRIWVSYFDEGIFRTDMGQLDSTVSAPTAKSSGISPLPRITTISNA